MYSKSRCYTVWLRSGSKLKKVGKVSGVARIRNRFRARMKNQSSLVLRARD